MKIAVIRPFAYFQGRGIINIKQQSEQSIDLLLKTVADWGRVLILPHNDPDPDAIASAAALLYLLEHTTSVKGEIAYKGIVGRAENRALVRYLNRPLITLEADILNVPVVLVDTQPGAGNNPWQPGVVLAGVIDHHPYNVNSDLATFVDVRPRVGATATIIFEYFYTLNLDLPAELATALFYGLKTDTRGLSRGVSQADAAAYYHLQSQVDTDALAEIERAQVPVSYFRSFANALASTQLFGTVAVCHVGNMEYPDMAAEMADLLVRLERVEWVVCTGVYLDTLLLAVRAGITYSDAGALVRAIVQNNGTAGGHDTMAGGQIPLKAATPTKMLSVLQQRLRQALKISPTAIPESLI